MSSAADVFDPYHEWLGIEPHELPADHYRLLGLARFEGDAAKIAAAADGRMKLIRSNQMGPRGAHAHAILNEIATARLCLLSPIAKAQYDRYLHERMRASGPAAAAPVAFFPTAVPLSALPPAYSPYQAAGVPTLQPPLAAPPVVPMATPLAPPKQRPKSELAVDVDKPPSEEEEPTVRSGSRLRLVGIMAIGVLAIAGGIWGASRYFFPPVADPNPQEVDGQTDVKPETPPDPLAAATVVLQEGSGELSLPPSAAALTGETTLKVAIADHVLAGWTSEEDEATWKFKLLRPGFFKLDLGYSAAHEGEDIVLQLMLDGEELHRFHLPPTGGEDTFKTVSHTVVVPSSGSHVLAIHPTGKVPAGSLRIKTLRLSPIGGKP